MAKKFTLDLNEIKKSLAPEEETVVDNILSLLQGLKNSGSAQAMEQPGAANLQDTGDTMMDDDSGAAGEPDQDDEEKKMAGLINKAIINTVSDENTGNDDVEERLEGVMTEDDMDGVEEVAKAVVDILNGNKRNVRKSVKNPLIPLIGEMTKVMKAQQDQIDEISTAFKGLVDGMGITEQLNIAQKSQTAVKPVLSNDNQRTLQFISDLARTVNKGQGNSYQQSGDQHVNNSERVMKTLSDRPTLTAMLG